MLLNSYILEIKNRILLVFICWFFVFVVSYFNKDTLFFLIISLSVDMFDLFSFHFIYTNLTDVLDLYLNVSYFISSKFTLVFILYHLLAFFAPGMFMYEYKKIKSLFLSNFIFNIIFIYIINSYVFVYIWSFFCDFNENYLNSVDVFFEAKIIDYFNFYKNIFYLFIIVSQSFFLIILFLINVGNKKKFLIKSRKYFLFFFSLISTLITPPDVFSQIMLILLFFIFFEFFVLLIFFNQYYKIL